MNSWLSGQMSLFGELPLVERRETCSRAFPLHTALIHIACAFWSWQDAQQRTYLEAGGFMIWMEYAQCECMAFDHDAHRGLSQLESPEFIHMTPSAPASVSAARAKPRRVAALQPEGLMPWTQRSHLECMAFSHGAQRELNQQDSPGFIPIELSALPLGLQPVQCTQHTSCANPCVRVAITLR